MSDFKADVRIINKVWEHTNADSLELASCDGLTFQFVIGKGQFSVGDTVIYIPVDSIMPADLVEFVGLTGRLGSNNRVRTIRLRGEISQGLVVDFWKLFYDFQSSKLQDAMGKIGGQTDLIGHDLTNALDIVKYEPPVVAAQNGMLSKMPGDVSIYDIQGTDRNPDIVEKYLMDVPVLVMEKLEGTNWWLKMNRDWLVTVGQRRRTITERLSGKRNMYWSAARDCGMIDAAQSILEQDANIESIVLRGELVGPGIQKNIYKLKKHRVYIFDVMLNGEYVDAEKLCAFGFHFPMAPILGQRVILRKWLGGRSVTDAAGGVSTFGDMRREGIVIRPMTESRHQKIGRMILKKRCPIYLAETGM